MLYRLRHQPVTAAACHHAPELFFAVRRKGGELFREEGEVGVDPFLFQREVAIDHQDAESLGLSTPLPAGDLVFQYAVRPAGVTRFSQQILVIPA